jgi:hypothetical protein
MKTLRHRIADSLSREEIQQNRQIDKALCDADIGNILQKIRIERVAMIALGCPDPFPVRTAD